MISTRLLQILAASLLVVALAPAQAGAGPKPKDFVFLQGLLAIGGESPLYTAPAGKVLVVTSIFLQSNSGGSPAGAAEYARVLVTGESEDLIFILTGPDQVALQLPTGMRVPSLRVLNAVGGNLVQYVVNGYLAKRPPGL